MAPPIARRTLLQGSLLVGVAGVLTACGVPSEPAPTPSPSEPTGTPTSAVPPPATQGAGGARPAAAESYGVNGTHYPAELPWLGDQAATEIVAECDWDDIADKIGSLTADQVAAGAVIRVLPGTLQGQGGGSGSPAVMTSLGSPDWTRNVLICPRDGFTSVMVSGEGMRIDKCANLSLFGFQCAGGLTLTQCDGVQIGWGRFDTAGVTQGGVDIAFYEIVVGFRQDEKDTAGVRPTDEFAMTNIQRYGCVFGPSVKPADSGSHCDTIQFEGTGSGPFGPIVCVDCVDYGSSNAVYQMSGPTQAEFRHCLILGGQTPWQVYPLRPGDYEGKPNAFSGGCPDVRVYDSAVVGAVGSTTFTVVENSTLSYSPQPSQQATDTGSWTVEEASTDWDRAQIMGMQAVADYELPTLRALWTW